MNSLLRVEHVTISYNGKPVVQDVSFELKQGEILGIVGESGSGKSTIVKAIMGLLGEEGLVTRGDIWYNGENLTDMSEKNSVGFWEQRSEWCSRTVKPHYVLSGRLGLRYMRQCQNMRKSAKRKFGNVQERY